MSDPRAEGGDHTDPDRGDPVLWQRHELLQAPGTGPVTGAGPGDGSDIGPIAAPAPAARAPKTGAPQGPQELEDPAADVETGRETVTGPGAATSAAETAETVDAVEVQLVAGSLLLGSGRVALPVAVVGPRELEPYLARHPHGEQHRGHGVIAVDRDGRPVRGEHGQWDYRAPGLRGWCSCGWTGLVHCQAPVPAQYERPPMREKAWREVNRTTRRAIDGEWLDHVYVALPTLGITVLRWQWEILKRAFPDAIEHARRYRAPWQDVGDELGVSSQSAHQRWRHLDPPPASDIESPPAEKPSSRRARPGRRTRHDEGDDDV